MAPHGASSDQRFRNPSLADPCSPARNRSKSSSIGAGTRPRSRASWSVFLCFLSSLEDLPLTAPNLDRAGWKPPSSDGRSCRRQGLAQGRTPFDGYLREAQGFACVQLGWTWLRVPCAGRQADRAEGAAQGRALRCTRAEQGDYCNAYFLCAPRPIVEKEVGLSKMWTLVLFERAAQPGVPSEETRP